MNNFARNAEGQDNTRNILDPKTFLEFLVKIFTQVMWILATAPTKREEI